MQSCINEVKLQTTEGTTEIERLEKDAAKQKEAQATLEYELTEYRTALQQARIELAVPQATDLTRNAFAGTWRIEGAACSRDGKEKIEGGCITS